MGERIGSKIKVAQPTLNISQDKNKDLDFLKTKISDEKSSSSVDSIDSAQTIELKKPK